MKRPVIFEAVKFEYTEECIQKLKKWHYVPCEKCFKNNKVVKLVKGTSKRGSTILLMLETMNVFGTRQEKLPTLKLLVFPKF